MLDRSTGKCVCMRLCLNKGKSNKYCKVLPPPDTADEEEVRPCPFFPYIHDYNDTALPRTYKLAWRALFFPENPFVLNSLCYCCCYYFITLSKNRDLNKESRRTYASAFAHFFLYIYKTLNIVKT